MDLVVP